MWLIHLPQWLKTSAINNQLAITSVNNIQWLSTKSDNNICQKIPKKVWLNSQTNDKYVKFWQKSIQIINHNILHTPSNVGVVVRKTFSHTLDEAMSVGLVKACDLRENLFC